MMDTLVIPLIGPMQSWGHRSRFDVRDSGLEPTRSGVIGLICCAMGIPREADISRFDSLRMGVRVDSPGQPKVDYQTAQDVVRSQAAHKRKPSATDRENVQSWRHYITDARFIVGLEAQDDHVELLQQIDAALRKPVWSLFLGRKSYVPSLPPFLPGSSIIEGKKLEDALREFPFYKLHEREPDPSGHLRLVLETRERGPHAHLLSDWPQNFETRSFALRAVMEDAVDPKSLPKGGVWPCISRN